MSTVVVVVHAGRHLPTDCRLRLALLPNAVPRADAPSPSPPPPPADALWVPTQPLRFELAWPSDDAAPIVSIEVWDCAKAYDTFVAAVQRTASATDPEWWTFPASNMALHISIVVKTTTITPPRTMDFRFEVPSHRIDWRALQPLHLGAIVHHVDTAALEACLDTVLYGDCNEDGELYPAMLLLQLAAQYANYCCETIAIQTSQLQVALDAANARRRRLHEKRSHATAKIEQLRRQQASLDDVLATFERVSTTTPP
ncbi:hypothetical protein SPRG_20567 [Saprolegnia parasitica CBS 223.65]|uniref:Cilium assembly protein DZIP1 N-terminal domain-containing protein n=1 Tax=Saprolegnia parasitica (strain CBS 223.65) TaxID=695850 RepID=A0A067CIZ1_SAPPC|nr:hypothetical protein SPRG_20567 [Saprolegnia parasitica CBS 223.65]KDO26762.1 hypothetical protein SPRG_20567 [Saprolegnia parasitica CBS 223.65]|eukprot:XP_012202519.1 hypothetical protein SPRG_20567 [Saprolegnia parasitica CBS 223.65]